MIDLNIKTIDIPAICEANNNDSISANVLIIGAGGTGSYFIRDALRFISNSTDNRIGVYRILIADGDIVEDKNISRQNFIYSDIGSYKAEVLATRYGTAFSLPVYFFNEYVDKNFFTKYRSSIFSKTDAYRSILIVLTFVDSVKTRLLIYKKLFYELMYFASLSYYSGILWIDAGNMKYNGQVVVSFLPSKIYKNFVLLQSPSTIEPECTNKIYTPTVVNIHRDLLVKENLDKYAYELSCEEAVQSFPQTINANLTAANISLNVFTQILRHGKINYNEVFFDCANNSYRTVYYDSKFEFCSIQDFYSDYKIVKSLLEGGDDIEN